MLSYPIALSRAIRRAVQTGELAEMEFIHTVQAAEGFQTCFGRVEGPCARVTCRWYRECMALAAISPTPPESALA